MPMSRCLQALPPMFAWASLRTRRERRGPRRTAGDAEIIRRGRDRPSGRTALRSAPCDSSVAMPFGSRRTTGVRWRLLLPRGDSRPAPAARQSTGVGTLATRTGRTDEAAAGPGTLRGSPPGDGADTRRACGTKLRLGALGQRGGRADPRGRFSGLRAQLVEIQPRNFALFADHAARAHGQLDMRRHAGRDQCGKRIVHAEVTDIREPSTAYSFRAHSI